MILNDSTNFGGMIVDWSVVATIVAPLITLFFGAAVNRAIEKRPRLVAYLGHVSAHRIQQENGIPLDVFTHSVVLKNAGRSPAHNVRLTHQILPNFDIFPGVQFETSVLPNGEIDIVVPILVPSQELTVSYLYHPPTTWNKINGPIRSDEGMAKTLSVLPTVQFPTWVNAIATGLMLLGIISLLYLFVHVLLLAM
ncbi:MAG: hypothetical protein OXF56_05515 [Rhodobacteraceae bacterium]|nr:hypothetical protein [Paracoccaceae bacterium]